MFRTTALIFALGMTPALATTAAPVDSSKMVEEQTEHAAGVITEVNRDNHTFTIRMDDGNSKRVTYGRDTDFVSGDEDSTARDLLRRDRRVSVEHSNGLASTVTYDRDADGDYETASGRVTGMDWDNNTFTIEMRNGESNRITYGDDTKFMLDGEEVPARELLRRELRVRVQHTDGLASSVSAREMRDGDRDRDRDRDRDADRDTGQASGTITAVDMADHTFTIEMRNGQKKQVTWGEDTDFSLDGDEAELEDILAQDNWVRVKHTDGLASEVHSSAAGEPEGDTERAQGTVTRVDLDDHTFTIEMDGEMKRVVYDGDTIFMMDDKQTNIREVIQDDRSVQVYHENGKAILVQCSS